MSQSVLVESVDNVMRVTWNDPARLNGLTAEMLATASDAIEDADASTRVIVLAGAGRAFSSGARLGGPLIEEDPMDAANRLIRAIVASPVPIVAAVNGPAAGFGCSVALAADITIAAQSSYFLLPFVNIGLMPDGGTTAVVAASIGRARASAMALLGERLAATEAARAGLIYTTVADADFSAEVDRVVGQLAGGARLAYRATKKAIAAATLGDLEAVLERESEGQIALFATSDFAEGTSAFLDKRAPEFTGR